MKFKALTLMLFLCVSAHGQSYSFSQSLASYIPLNPDSSVSVNKGNLWDDDTTFSIPIGFKFRFIDQDYDHVRILLGNVLFGDRFHSFSSCAAVVMADRADSPPSLSPISYQLTGDSGKRILKIEWKNAGFVFDTVSYANFQTWLYEGSNTIEARYGKSDVPARFFQTQRGGPQVGVLANAVNGEDSFMTLLNGDADSPQVKRLSDTGHHSLTSMPKEGKVYTFYYSATTGIASNNTPTQFSFYPNPATDYIHIICPEKSKIIIRNSMGEIVHTESTLGDGIIHLVNFSRGIYFVSMSSLNGMDVKKLVVE